MEGALQSNETENRKSPPQNAEYTFQDISEKIHPIHLKFVGLASVWKYVENCHEKTKVFSVTAGAIVVGVMGLCFGLLTGLI